MFTRFKRFFPFILGTALLFSSGGGCASLGFDEQGRRDFYKEIKNFPSGLSESILGFPLYQIKD